MFFRAYSILFNCITFTQEKTFKILSMSFISIWYTVMIIETVKRWPGDFNDTILTNKAFYTAIY